MRGVPCRGGPEKRGKGGGVSSCRCGLKSGVISRLTEKRMGWTLKLTRKKNIAKKRGKT